MSNSRLWLLVAVAILALSTTAFADMIAPPYNADYTLTNIGTPTAVPGPLGGIVFLNGDPNELLVGGSANGGSGAIYEIGVTRGVGGHITGFSGPATFFASAPFIDGGLAYAPNGDLFFTGYPNNTLGEIKPGDTSPDKTVNLTAAGIAGSVGSLQFAPNGQFKILSYSGGGFYTATLAPDGMGTYDVTSTTLESTPGRGPEGVFYVPLGSPDFPLPSLLLAEYSTGTVGAYQVDANGNPIVATRTDFITGLGGAEGATIDPLTGDFLFSTFGGGNHIDVVSGFANNTVPEPSEFLPLFGGLFVVAGYIVRRRRA